MERGERGRILSGLVMEALRGGGGPLGGVSGLREALAKAADAKWRVMERGLYAVGKLVRDGAIGADVAVTCLPCKREFKIASVEAVEAGKALAVACPHCGCKVEIRRRVVVEYKYTPAPELGGTLLDALLGKAEDCTDAMCPTHHFQPFDPDAPPVEAKTAPAGNLWAMPIVIRRYTGGDPLSPPSGGCGNPDCPCAKGQ